VAIERNATAVARIDVAAACDAVGTVRLVADFLGGHGAALAPGDRILAGSLAAPLLVAPGDAVSADFGPLGRLSLAFTA
jgi:2-keto-4-pentenoate hydratase